MLVGKLTTPALKSYEVSPFETTVVEAHYLAVKADGYVIGNPEVRFELRFGNIKGDVPNQELDVILRSNLIMTVEELSTWGFDDSVVLDLIAAKLGNTITEKVSINSHFTY